MSRQLLNSLFLKKDTGKTFWKESLKILPYVPFKGIDNYYLVVDERKKSTTRFLFYTNFKDKEYLLRIKTNGYIPKSGILLCDYLTALVSGKRILEIGTGETGIIAIHSARNNAKEVVACDIDMGTLMWAQRHSKLNNLKNITWVRSDIFDSIKMRGKFDLIISNPPQMPMKFGHLHDCGGFDGRRILERIIKNAKQYLSTNGKLILLVFDFLGLKRSYGNNESLFHMLEKENFKPLIISSHKRIIRKGGQTERSIEQINQVYPRFIFSCNKKGEFYHQVHIISSTLKGLK